MKYDAINLGEKDLQFGHEFLERMRSKYHLPFVSANVYYSGTKKLFAKPYLIKKYSGVKIGIFGIAKKEGVQRYVKPETGFEISDPVMAARAAVDYLRRECDVVIALSHLGLSGSRNLAKTVSGIDIIISGHDGQKLKKPEQIGSAVLMQAGAQGKYLGQIDFTFAAKRVVVSDGKIVALNDKIPDDPRLAGVVKEFDDALLKTYPMESADLTGKVSEISERKCMTCHPKQYTQWRRTGHYKAWQSLVAKARNLDQDCQRCHTSRFGKTAGFKSVYDTPDMVNVQCAECHREKEGHISTHLNRSLKKLRSSKSQSNGHALADFKPITEQTCLKCHDQKNSPNFNFKDYLAQVTH